MLIDLHVHSTASDGTLSPTEIVIHAKEKGLTAIALTDHDTIKGLKEAIEAGQLYKLEVIPGIELSADFPNDSLHILGYGIDYKSEKFKSKLHIIQENRKIRNEKILSNLKQLGFEISINNNTNIVTRAHFASALYKAGYVKSFDEAFKNYLSPGKPAYVKRITPSPKECIDIIHSGGGLAFLAHPTLYNLNSKEISSLITKLKNWGLDGIEAIHSVHNKQDEIFLKDLAARNDLLISGGSDFHGNNKPKLELARGYGNLKIPYHILDDIKNALKNHN